MRQLLLLAFSLFILISNALAEKRKAIEMQLINIEKSISGESVTDSTNISNTQNPIGLNITSYSDSLMKISWMYNLTHLDFILENISKESYKILWDDMSYIDIDNNGHRIFHKGIKMNDREKPQAPTVVMKKTNLNDIIIPYDYVEYSDYFKRWVFRYLNPSGKAQVENKEIRVLMPIEIKGNIIEYIFTFRLKDLKIKKKAGMNSDGSWSYR